MLFRIVLLCLAAPLGVFGYPYFAQQIPNGESVPHPGPQKYVLLFVSLSTHCRPAVWLSNFAT